MPRPKGSGSAGPPRSVRLPLPLDQWFEQRAQVRPEGSSSELLVELIHGGLRLRDGYMSIHRHALERRLRAGDDSGFAAYVRALDDTFGETYVDHVRSWLKADGIDVPERQRSGSG